MADNVAAKVRAVPYGYKKCPACSGLVKGPRTKVCQGCGHTFKSKGGKPVKAVKPVKVVAQAVVVEDNRPAVIPDPYTFAVNAGMSGKAFNVTVGKKKFNGVRTIAKAFPHHVMPNNIANAMKFAANLQPVANDPIENDVQIA